LLKHISFSFQVDVRRNQGRSKNIENRKNRMHLYEKYIVG